LTGLPALAGKAERITGADNKEVASPMFNTQPQQTQQEPQQRSSVPFFIALTLALAFVAAILTTAPPARAVESPEPDPAFTLRVKLSTPTVKISVPVPTTAPVGRVRCAGVWGAGRYLGGACAKTAVVRVPVTLVSRTWPLGQTTIWLSDESSRGGRWVPAVVDARMPSQFGVGTWTDLGRGDLAVRAPLKMRDRVTGQWVARPGAVVQVQKLVRGRWVLVGKMKTSKAGVAAKTFHIGGGIFWVRVVAQADWKTWSTAGTKRKKVVTTEPLDVDSGVVQGDPYKTK
jgi:hypothetical protein